MTTKTVKKPVAKKVAKKTVKTYRPITAAKLAKMTPENKRIMVAKDVLSRLAAKQLKASSGIYILAPKNGAKDEVDAGKVLNNQKCEVCALGAIFVSAVCKFDKYKVGELTTDEKKISAERYELTNYLEDFFSIEQMDLIEAAFEGIDISQSCSGDEEVAANDFYRRYAYKSERLGAIMKNIIRNKGTFKPQLEKEQTKRE